MGDTSYIIRQTFIEKISKTPSNGGKRGNYIYKTPLNGGLSSTYTDNISIGPEHEGEYEIAASKAVCILYIGGLSIDVYREPRAY